MRRLGSPATADLLWVGCTTTNRVHKILTTIDLARKPVKPSHLWKPSQLPQSTHLPRARTMWHELWHNWYP